MCLPSLLMMKWVMLLMLMRLFTQDLEPGQSNRDLDT